MLKAYIVEDEYKAIALLETYIQRVDYLELAGTTRNPLTAFSFIQENAVDVLFLDINMPILSGIELLKSISDPPKVIFTTAYSEFAVEGFALEAVDYLLKPISFPRFLKACDRLKKQHAVGALNVQSEDDVLTDIIYVKSGAILHKLSWKKILYLEKNENYVVYHTPEKRILSRQTLSDICDIFPSYFCRIHKSIAVSLLHISKIEREAVFIKEIALPIGRTYRQLLLERIEQFNQLE